MAIEYPNESPEYRRARNELLSAEIALRESTAKVAAMRAELPLGGEIKEDYAFEGRDGTVRLSELFGDKNTLFTYALMYGPNATNPCPLCSSFLDALDGNVRHILPRAAVAIIARSSYARIQELARSREWNNLPLYSSEDCSFHPDYHAEKDSYQMPMANVFVRRNGAIHHFWGSEMLYAPAEGDSRHIDTMWPLWNVLDLTPEGRGETYYPAL